MIPPVGFRSLARGRRRRQQAAPEARYRLRASRNPWTASRACGRATSAAGGGSQAVGWGGTPAWIRTLRGADEDATMNDLQTVTTRWRDTLVPGIDAAPAAAVAPAHELLVARAETLAAAQMADGHWTDIDYDDPALDTSWPCALHVDRLAALATAWRVPGLAQPRRQGLQEAVVRGLAAWLARDPQHWNWWYNQIGIPMPMGTALLMATPSLPPELLTGGLQVLARAHWEGATGANLTWLASIQIVRGCLEGRADRVRAAVDAIAAEVRLAAPRGEGIQADWSFHQHGEILMSGSYGLPFAVDTARLVAITQGTTFAFTDAQIDILSAYMLDGQQWMIRGRTFDYGAVGREICRQGKDAAPLLAGLEAMIRAGVPRREEFVSFAARLRQAAAEPLVGHRHFWKSDFSVHHRPAWYASVRMHSNRVDNTDSCCTHENRRSHLIADGVNLLLKTGDEYRDLFPVWDWKRLPGVTADLDEAPYIWQTVRQRGVRDFVGGVSDGTYGAAWMDLARWNLFAGKGWFFFDHEYACAGRRIQGGVFAPATAPVITTINQCHRRGAITVAGAAGRRQLADGEYRLDAVGWVHHDRVGYVFPAPGAAVVRIGTQQGRWTDIGQEPPGEVSAEVFSLWLEHGSAHQAQAYRYLVVPDIGVDGLAAYAAAPPVEVIEQKAAIAAYHRSTAVLSAVFTGPGRLVVASGPDIEVDQRCVLVYRPAGDGTLLAVANPLNLPTSVVITVGGRLRGPGVTTADDDRSRVTVQLPDGSAAGSSVVLKLEWR
jgi:chondroitin AC lyase